MPVVANALGRSLDRSCFEDHSTARRHRGTRRWTHVGAPKGRETVNATRCDAPVMVRILRANRNAGYVGGKAHGRQLPKAR